MSKQRNGLSRSIRRYGCLFIVAAIALPSEAQTDRVEKPKPQIGLAQRELQARPDQAKTADELLKLVDDRSGFRYLPAKLPPAEAKLAAEKLRERFPFESIRERMDFQGPVEDRDLIKVGPKKIATSIPGFKGKAVQGKTFQGMSKLNPNSISRKHVMFDPRPSRTIALEKLHSEEVAGFINSPGNGFTRMRSVSPYDLGPRNYAKRLESRNVGSEILGESIVRLKTHRSNAFRYALSDSGMPTTNLIESFNQQLTGYFAINTGLVQGLDKVAGFESHQTRMPEAWNGNLRMLERKYYENQPGADINWKANRIQLVSLLLHDEPRVYVSENLPNMEELSGSDVETRALDDFETTSLEKMKQGETLINRATHNRILMMGSLRANENCLQCHDVKENDLLGAFSYEFLREPQSKPADAGL